MSQPTVTSCNLCGNLLGSAFRDLTPDEITEISEQKSCVFFKKGQILIQEGSRPHGVYCIHHGKAKLFKLGSGGKEQIIRFAKDGDLIGYRSLLSGETISASVAALDDLHACFIPKNALFSLIEENPKFSLHLMKMACHELGEAGRLITNLAQKTVRERLAEVLLLLHHTFGNDPDGNLNVPLTREEIANMVGTATESVIRLLSEFKQEGHIALNGRKIRLEDTSALVRIGNVYD
ncbi:MAG: Crp/Fnr family transcriptional regulator [Bacteroidota bacterium]|nr:Crp/Fnr family transcriptional regulator [Bacteroidota bacterium]MDX5449009.1 Crp/Fnr family transcriptional regulator [Bacteroidota bacterium]MDX5504751.1 Crp/Fnr family transcriptional regulator [Bacteroidota bacterium]